MNTLYTYGPVKRLAMVRIQKEKEKLKYAASPEDVKLSLELIGLHGKYMHAVTPHAKRQYETEYTNTLLR